MGKQKKEKEEAGRRGGDRKETGGVAINSKLARVHSWRAAPWRRGMALPVGLLSVSIYWFHSAAGLQRGGEQRCDSAWGRMFENLSCHV